MERMVLDEPTLLYMRSWAWWRLVMIRASLRLGDHMGIRPMTLP